MSKLDLTNLKFDVTDLAPFLCHQWYLTFLAFKMCGASVIFSSYHVLAYHYYYYKFCVPFEHCFSFDKMYASSSLIFILFSSLFSSRWRRFCKFIYATKFTYSNGKDNCFRAPWLRPIHHSDMSMCEYVSVYMLRKKKRIHIIKFEYVCVHIYDDDIKKTRRYYFFYGE